MKMWIFGVAALAAATCFGATTEDGVTKERRGALGPNDTVVTDVDTTGIVAARTYTKDEIDRRIATNAPVRSVNGRTGRVVLGASDVGALPDNRDDLKANANFRNAVWDVQIKSGGGVDTNAVREIAGEVVAPVEAAVADRYTKAEADAKFVPMNFPEPYSGGFEWVPDGLALKSESVFTIPSAGNLMVGGYTLGEFLSRGFWNTSNNKFIRNDSFSVVSNKVEQKADKATTLSGYGITDAAPLSMISASNPAFSNAVLAVGIDTNAVAQIGELKEFFDDLPVGTVGTSLGGIILALLAAVSWLKKNALTDGLETDGTPTDVKLDKFFTESNSLLNARITYERNATGLKDRAFNALTFDGTEFNLSSTLASVTPTSDGQPRDLLIVATATAATTISFTAGTIKGDKPTIDGAGTWLITLTEYAANTWYCRQIKMEDAQ